jgi:hypothetical protein
MIKIFAIIGRIGNGKNILKNTNILLFSSFDKVEIDIFYTHIIKYNLI